MRSLVRPAAVLLGLFTLLTGVAYPLLVTLVAQTLFPAAAQGTMITAHGRQIGSASIGQPCDDPRLFWGRPSAIAPQPDRVAASTGSNLGPSNPLLAERVRVRVAALRAADPASAAQPVPIDLATASGSGLDPHVSPAAALYQVPRVARARGLSEARLRSLVAAHVTGRTFGLLGEPRVNVLALNLALAQLAPKPR